MREEGALFTKLFKRSERFPDKKFMHLMGRISLNIKKLNLTFPLFVNLLIEIKLIR